ncbi:hypothetical protein TorRG33x02_144360 [Trema orientale]|uniref:Uncharacterized protein n=1 Tax=Trema orientale TaxID=63057 RepID=A0A2P5EW33_TREOI|nr:hypothetical protein TorRG33x02_144360 [Trema orientale]
MDKCKPTIECSTKIRSKLNNLKSVHRVQKVSLFFFFSLSKVVNTEPKPPKKLDLNPLIPKNFRFLITTQHFQLKTITNPKSHSFKFKGKKEESENKPKRPESRAREMGLTNQPLWSLATGEGNPEVNRRRLARESSTWVHW